MSDSESTEIFTKNLKYYMNLNGKDRVDICRDLNIPYTTFADWYNGKIYPRIEKIDMLANYFKVQKSDLIEQKKFPLKGIYYFSTDKDKQILNRSIVFAIQNRIEPNDIQNNEEIRKLLNNLQELSKSQALQFIEQVVFQFSR